MEEPVPINGTLSKLMGSHSVKVGADMRRMGVATVSDTQMGGRFDFNRLFTSNNGVGGHELASVLLGAPYSGWSPSTMDRSSGSRSTTACTSRTTGVRASGSL